MIFSAVYNWEKRANAVNGAQQLCLAAAATHVVAVQNSVDARSFFIISFSLYIYMSISPSPLMLVCCCCFCWHGDSRTGAEYPDI